MTVDISAWHMFASVSWNLATYDILLFGAAMFLIGFLSGLGRKGD